MQRSVYSALWWLALPAVFGRLWWRGRKEPGYRQHLGERLALAGPVADGTPTILLHAVSVGETRAAEPLLSALLQAYPGHRIVLTHMTPTGRATGASLYGRHGARVVQAYLPYDTGAMMRRFLRRIRPSACILMETEVWPNLIHACRALNVPVVLANARLSERSLVRGQKAGAVMLEAAQGFALVAAQTEADAARIRSLGAPHVAVTGSIKFDVVPPQAALDKGAWLRALMGPRPVFLCASTREGEEALLLDAWQRAPGKPDNALLVLVPRHPQRFDEVAGLVSGRGLQLVRRSALAEGATHDGALAQAQVLLGDSMGEMFAYYAACDCAYIGGSLLPLGGQNLIEACALGKPVLVGAHTFNFLDATEQAVACGAARRASNAGQLVEQALGLLQDEAGRALMGERALAFALQHRGATLRTVELLRAIIG